MTIPIALAPCAKPDGYRDAIRRAGGEPVLLDYAADPPDQVIARGGGLLLPGGKDIGPSYFDEAPHPTFAPSEPGRDEYEIALLRAAADADRPVLAICRGMQVLNVAHGGALIQDIPDLLRTAGPHWLCTHDVVVHDGTLLQRLLRAAGCGPDRIHVTSRHHQAIGRLGRGIVTSARAGDGVIEAIELGAARFCLGVQWHPEESLHEPASAALFEGFVEAARRWDTR